MSGGLGVQRGSQGWRRVGSPPIASNIAAGAAAGQYHAGVSISGSIAAAPGDIFRGTTMLDLGTTFKLRARVVVTGSSDPTATLRISLYAITLGATTGGYTITADTEISGSVMTPSIATRGVVAFSESSVFTGIDAAKTYAIITEIVGAGLGAGNTLRAAPVDLYAR